jgi:hypothetical protein
MKFFLDGPISPTEAVYTVKSNTDVITFGPCTCHSSWSTSSSAQQLPSPHTKIEAQQLQSPQQWPLQLPLKDKEASQLPSPPTEIEAPKDKEASPVHDMPPPSSSPYDTIHEDLALYKTKPHSDPTDQFFATMRNLKSLVETSSAMSTPAQHVETYMRACKIESCKEDGEVYNRDKPLVRPHDPIFMKEHVPEKFVFGKPFLTTTQLSKRPFPLRRLHNWYMTASSLGVMNITFEISGNAFYSGVRIGSIDFEDLWFMFHQKWLYMNLCSACKFILALLTC